MRYRCLIIDHDDTSVNSTLLIHYPAYLASMKTLRPGIEKLNFEQYMIKNFDPGLVDFLTNELNFDRDEILEEIKIWRGFTEKNIPDFFPGFIDFLKMFREKGGIIAVVSHSEKNNIERDYRGKSGMIPDIIFGWDHDEKKRKPDPYPVKEVIRHFKLSRDEVIVLDDLKPGLIMARNAGVDFAAAGWAYDIPVIANFMKENSDYYFKAVEELKDFVFGNN